MKSYKRHVVGKVTFTSSKEIIFIEQEGNWVVDVVRAPDEEDGHNISWKDFAPHLTEQDRDSVRNTSMEVVEGITYRLDDVEAPVPTPVQGRKVT